MTGMRIKTTQDAPECVLSLHGELSADTHDELLRSLGKHLLDRVAVLVDLSMLTVTVPSATRVFPSALAEAGGWPSARLVLFGADPATSALLNAERIPVDVPLATDRTSARPLLGVRPERVTRTSTLPADVAAAGQARDFVDATCAGWAVTDRFPYATLVASELVTNAVTHAGTEAVLIVSLDRQGLHLAVRDGQADGAHRIRTGRDRPGDGRGLHLVSELTRAWGVSAHPDGKTVWAVLSSR